MKSCRCDLLFHKCFMWQAREATRPLFASGPRDNSEFSALKQLMQNSVVFPGESRTIFPAACLFSSFQKADICQLKHLLSLQLFPPHFPFQTLFFLAIPLLKRIVLVRCSVNRPSLVGTSLLLCVSCRMAVEGLNHQSLYIILCPAGPVDATIMSC